MRALTRGALKALGLDRQMAGLWLFQLWSRSHQGESPSESFGNMAFYGAVFLAAVLAIRALGAGMGVAAFAALLNVVPRVLSVVLILLLGGLLAAFVSAVVQLALAGAKRPHTVFWGKVAAWTTFGASILFSLEPLGLAGQLLTEALPHRPGIAGLGGGPGLRPGLQRSGQGIPAGTPPRR